jgi:uncharacterized protein with HEPN domain
MPAKAAIRPGVGGQGVMAQVRDIEQAAGLAGQFLTASRCIHGHAEVDHRIVWEVAAVEVPALAAEVRALLGAAEPPDAL